jgi:hypothetical protein
MMRFVICSKSTFFSPNFDRFAKFKSRRSLLTSTQKIFNSKALLPINSTVRLHNNTLVTVPVFYTKHMIISFSTDPSVMNKKNFAEGYNVLTGEVDNHSANYKYGEVHTGDAWLPARDRYCQNKTDIPVGLIVFGDKSHTDLHGALSLTPIIFTLTLFNHAAQNDSKFWRPIGYIPNLGYRRGTSNKTHTLDKIQDEHSCISFAFQSLKKHQQRKWIPMCCVGTYSACQSLNTLFYWRYRRKQQMVGSISW